MIGYFLKLEAYIFVIKNLRQIIFLILTYVYVFVCVCVSPLSEDLVYVEIFFCFETRSFLICD